MNRNSKVMPRNPYLQKLQRRHFLLFMHLVGSRPLEVTDDNSRNSALVNLFTWGEGWDNNHHAFPNSASFGLAWYRFGIGYWFIRACQLLGLVWNVRVPDSEKIAHRRRAQSRPIECYEGPAPLKPNESQICEWCIGYLATLLDISAAKIDPNAKLARLGMDSALMVRSFWRSRVG